MTEEIDVADSELELYYERKIRIALDVLDELERLELDPRTDEAGRMTVREQRPEWEREFTLARAQYAGVLSGQSTIPLPPQSLRQRLSELSDAVEVQINANKAANAGIAAATKVAEMLGELKKLP